MAFAAPPPVAAWRHLEAREGHEIVHVRARPGGGWRLDGRVVAVEVGEPWSVDYAIDVDERWVTRRARVWPRSATGGRSVELEHDGAGRWRVGAAAAPELDGCLDADLEASAMTNVLPVRRMALAVGEEGDAPAAYVRVADLPVGRLEQRYRRRAEVGPGRAFDYAAPSFAFACRLACDAAGLAVDYPGIAVRVA